MFLSSNIFLNLLPFAAFNTASPISRSRDKFDWSSKKALIRGNNGNRITFGDSYTYVQGTHGHQNYSFIGDQFDFAYDAQTLLSNKIVQNQTATAEGGPNWVEFLTKCGLEEGLTSPRSCKKQLWDFAFAGADISTELSVTCPHTRATFHQTIPMIKTNQTASTPLHHNFTVSLVNQVTQFKDYGTQVLQEFLPAKQSLVAIWIGINDVGDSSKYAVNFPTFYANLTRTLFASADQLYDIGYKSYLIMNLPPLDRTPGNQATSTPHPNATQVAWYNDALTEAATKFGKGKGDVEIRVFDAHARLSAILDDPGRYGIVNTTNFCAGYDQPDIETNYKAYGCPTPLETYFWFNSGHMTSHVHRILATELEEWLQS
ncbi:hypothetical protein N7462_011317 [Penicillium macrosclerotiorum]|uniref:uncharacterized protein n=1 Tax=Penicillium macrosclerotiorum TaxID=303699 RepID=UPI0025473C8E|nr:uncharacterized protein N7462_011317 [Penicillium macrosclerotiorum]KAJ5666908.1 hypothetical protein N7462_011317 [Penicillium macrosclerotiorum]